MKKSLLIVLAILIVSTSCVLVPLADTDDGDDISATASQSDNTVPTVSNTDYPVWQIAVMYCIMFAGISVIGVMFIKVVKKNKHQ